MRLPKSIRATGKHAAFLTTATAAFMVALDNLVVVTDLPAMRESFASDIEEPQWTVSAYTLT
jgi:hypothetical protein